MKRLFAIPLFFISVFFASCKKDRTCSCTSITVDKGTYYHYTNYNQTATPYSSSAPTDKTETRYNRISKKYGNEACPASDISVSNYDRTTTYLGYQIEGNKGTYTTTKTCELK